MVYTVTMNPAVDYVVYLDNVKRGAINRSNREEVYFGGKGINVSLVLQQLGVESTALGFIAGFTGRGLEEGLQNQGIRTSFIEASGGMTRINVKIKDQAETDINGIGPIVSIDNMLELTEQIRQMSEVDILVLSGSIPGGLPSSIYEEILKEVEKNGTQAIIDASGELLLRTLKYHPFLIKPNHVELGELFGRDLINDDEIVQAARILQQKGARNVLVSMGGEGAIFLDEDQNVRRIQAPQGEVISTTGAGDSMVAGFIAGFMLHGDYEEALQIAVASGSATAFTNGLASRALILQVLQQVEEEYQDFS